MHSRANGTGTIGAFQNELTSLRNQHSRKLHFCTPEQTSLYSDLAGNEVHVVPGWNYMNKIKLYANLLEKKRIEAQDLQNSGFNLSVFDCPTFVLVEKRSIRIGKA